MRARRKTLEDLRRSPKNVSAADLRRVLEENGCEIRGGTLHGFVVTFVRTGRTFSFPRSHDKHLKAVYVRNAVRIVEEEQGK